MSFKEEDQLAISLLLSYLGQYSTLSEGLATEYRNHCSVSKIKKNKFILSPMDNNRFLYFIVSGTARGFIRDRGKDITTWFAFQNEIIGTICHPDGQEIYEQEYLHALEDCLLVCIPHDFMNRICEDYPEANIIGRKLMAIQYFEASKRSILARITKASDRYRKLTMDSEKIIREIPLRYIASYLSIRVETLSRIRKKDLHSSLKLIDNVA
ncbi:Crp/Fnr family transcriptional regulator [Pedobacter yonginense]|uniref:Crp/Fnr family transcriptional regulator n=1 Tax=Pedobacter yonginense TaxID=651869 RepID=A0A317EJF0_9SPHI|nr:Crp/Fnr family transcriptional regulator [Pedobacter yonginense]PWS26704.1 Crp/Fnr family transcriptional regulator [Pedobacter yonginense]